MTRSRRPAFFLDRDGVINERRIGLVRRPHQLHLLPGVADAMRRLAATNHHIVVVTNQGAAGTGWIPDLDAIHDRLRDLVEGAGGRIDAIEACTHARWRRCDCRKPDTGMLERASTRLDIRREGSWMVGDKPTDVETGRRFGVSTCWVHGGRKYAWERAWDVEADLVVAGLAEFTDHVLDTDG